MNKTVLITGSSRGIGRAVALKYAALGCRIVLNCRDDVSGMAAVKEEVLRLGADCLAVQADVGKKDGCIRLFAETEKTFGDVDILINNAGVSWTGLIQDMDFEEWDRLIAANLSSVFFCCKLAVPGMIRKHAGDIVNVSSVWGVCGASCETAYSASKGGVNAFTRALAKELAPSGIRVNAIACGLIDTQMNRFLAPEEIDALLEEIPAGRMGTPEEAAELILHLTETPAYLTGQVIRLDGGWI